MSERSNTISKLKSSFETRYAYISAKLSTLVPSQIRALRLKSDMARQSDLARASEMKQSRISVLETPGAANATLDTLSRIAAAFEVGLVVKFVPFSEMLTWENSFSQDQFDVDKIHQDFPFLNPAPASIQIPAQPAVLTSVTYPTNLWASMESGQNIVIDVNPGPFLLAAPEIHFWQTTLSNPTSNRLQ